MNNALASKKAKIKKMVIESLECSVKEIKNNLIDRVLNSGAVDVENWDEKSTPMLLPKAILIALLQREADQYSATGTSYEKHIKKNVRNIRCFV
jgi:hypothetical protein